MAALNKKPTPGLVFITYGIPKMIFADLYRII